MIKNLEDTELARRAFLAKCGKYALVTPPVVTLMLSVSGTNNYALALSGSGPSGGGGGGGGNANNGGGGGSGSNNPGILQSRGGSANSDELARTECRIPREARTSWRDTCQRPDRPNFEIETASPAQG